MKINEDKIRKRKSYQMFKEYLEYIKIHTPEECLKELHKILDNRYSYGSEKAANYAIESLNLLLKDDKK